jgi:hypothetical protein
MELKRNSLSESGFSGFRDEQDKKLNHPGSRVPHSVANPVILFKIRNTDTGSSNEIIF